MAEARVTLPEDFDFESYINSYEGHTRISRSVFIAQRCDALAVEAYKTALKEIKETTTNVKKYKAILEKLNSVLRSQGEAVIPVDQDWINTAQEQNKTTLESLELELKAAKASLNKEEIRISHTKLGDYYYKKGDLPDAAKNYIRTRDYCATSRDVLDMCFNTIKVYLDDSYFSHVVQTYITRADSLPNMPDKVHNISKLRCCQALAYLSGTDNTERYGLIANVLTEVSYESASYFNTIMSPNDVAIYGGLCAVVSMDRRQLQTQVLNNTNFKSFLGSEPLLNEMIESFYKAKYSRCLQILDKYNQLLKLDMYLSPHLNNLYQLVREKAMIQYCIPYSMIDMHKMASSINISVDQLENELIDLIGKKKKIYGRINGPDKILYMTKTDKRDKVIDRSLQTGKNYEKEVKAIILRMKMIENGLVVKPE